MGTGKNISIYLEDGSGTGIRLAEVMNWSGQAIASPREKAKALATWPEVARNGAYFLFGDSLSDDMPTVYIGEAENVFDRLKNHLVNKDFWTEVVILTSKDAFLTKAHGKYLESRFIGIAQEACRYRLENGNEPRLPALPRGHIDAMEEFIEQTRLVLGALGFPVLKPLAPRAAAGETMALDTLFTFSARGVEAQGLPSEGGFVVLEGSQASGCEFHENSAHLERIRSELVDSGVLIAAGQNFRFSRDHLFSSPSRAAAVVAGSSQNGRVVWKNREGQSLKELEDAEV